MTNPYLEELDRRLGLVAVLSLTQRHLIPPAGRAGDGSPAGAAPADRVAGAVIAAAAGSALGLPREWAASQAAPWGDVVASSLADAPVSADVQLLAASTKAMLDHDLAAAPALAAWLAGRPHLRNPGRATPAVVQRLGQGCPWFEAGVGSYGNGAVVRAVAAGLVFAERPDWRPIVAALDAVVTHGTPEAAATSGAVAETVAGLLGSPSGGFDLRSIRGAVAPAVARVIDEILARLDAGAGPPLSGATALGAFAAALYHATLHPTDPEAAISSAIGAGGDTDTVAALTGAFVGAGTGLGALPDAWRRIQGGAELLALAARLAPPVPPAQECGATEPGPDDSDLHIHFLLDRSGSMSGIAGDVVGGFNAFLATHRTAPGKCSLTLAQFDSQDPFEVLLEAPDIATMADLDPRRYQPRGTTPLYDALGTLLDHAEADAARRPDRDQLVVVFTDGLENASRNWDRQRIFLRVDELRARGFTFAFLGANQDSYAEGVGLGVAAGNVSNFRPTAQGTKAAWASVERAAHLHRGKDRLHRRADQDRFFDGVKEAEQTDGGW